MDGEPDRERGARDDIAALERRIAAIERALRIPAEHRCPHCDRVVPAGRYCVACGHDLTAPPRTAPSPLPTPSPPPPVRYTRVHPPTPTPPATAPVPNAPTPAPELYSPPPVAPRAAPAPVAPRERVSVEKMLGQRWAPRLGAMLVFLGIVFFLGVAIQRGWIGPILQLVIAAVVGVGLLASGAILTARRGYGTYPQILEATGICVLYVTAFVSYAAPYYRSETHFTELASGALMALVSVGAVGLALHRNARIIAGLGYSLAFATALLGQDALPALTIAYVALLGTSLAFLVARKGWLLEGTFGSLATGGFFLSLALRAGATGDPEPWLVVLCALPPIGAFLWLATRPRTAGPANTKPEAAPTLVATLTLATFAWGPIASTAPFAGDLPASGIVFLLWAVIAGGHMVLSARRGAYESAPLVAGIVGIALWLIGAPLAWSDATSAPLLVTLTYAAGAIALASIPRRAVAWGALALTCAAALEATFVMGPHEATLTLPQGSGIGPGTWEAWLAWIVIIGAAATLILRGRRAYETPARAAFYTAATFTAIWAFALGTTPLTVTLILLIMAGAAFALATPTRGQMRSDMIAAMVGLLVIAAAQSALFVGALTDTSARIEGALLLAALIAATVAVARSPIDAALRAGLGTTLLATLVAWPYAFWTQTTNGPFLASATYAVAALSTGLLAHRAMSDARRTAWTSALTLAGAAVAHSIILQGEIRAPWEAAGAVGSLEAWITFALIGSTLAIVLLPTGAREDPLKRGIAFGLAATFAAIWTFALFHTPFVTTAWLVLMTTLLATLAIAVRTRDGPLARQAIVAAFAVLAVAALKTATIDMHAPDVQLTLPWAIGEAILVASALLALFHIGRAKQLYDERLAPIASWGLVGGSALVLADLILTYAEGASTSILLGILGVTYLGVGLGWRQLLVHRYTGFAVLGLVILRVFSIDLRATDLAIRALVFAVLGAILLGVGYAYARINKKETANEPGP